MVDIVAQYFQNAVVSLTLDEEGREENGDVLHEIGKAFEQGELVSGDGGKRKKSKGNTDKRSDVGGIGNAVELNHIFSTGETLWKEYYLRPSLCN